MGRKFQGSGWIQEQDHGDGVRTRTRERKVGMGPYGKWAGLEKAF